MYSTQVSNRNLPLEVKNKHGIIHERFILKIFQSANRFEALFPSDGHK